MYSSGKRGIKKPPTIAQTHHYSSTPSARKTKGFYAMNERESLDDFFRKADSSAAFAAYCTDAFGMNIAQDSLADKRQIDYLLNYVHFNGNDVGLQIGSGNGKVAAYVAEQTGARMTGIERSEQAVANARKNGNGKTNFIAQDFGALVVPDNEYSAILLMDSLPEDTGIETLEYLYGKLMPGGRIGVLYTEYVRDPRHQKRKLEIGETKISRAIRLNRWNSKAVDFCDQLFDLVNRKAAASERYKGLLEKEGNEVLYETVRRGLPPVELVKKDFEKQANRYLYCIYK